MTSAESLKACQAAFELWDRGELDAASNVLKKVLNEDVNHVLALKLMAHVHDKAGNGHVAYHLFKRATELAPDDGNALANFGRVAQDLWRTQEAERAQIKSLGMTTGTEKANTLVNLAALKCDTGKWTEAEKYARDALALSPESRNARANLGFAQLAQHNWAEGWANYHYSVGTSWRPKVQYKDEPEWDGSPGKAVVLYGEQGIGDEISFASMVPDALDICGKVIIDCDKRLEGLFKRSFPHATVYGTRGAKAGKWDKADREFDCSLPMGQLGEFFRTDAAQFPGTPYLKPCPDRVRMWRALWDRPAIGIAWRGGIPKSGSKYRRFTLEQLVPLFRSVPGARWVCLEYKDARAEIAEFVAKYPDIDLVQYPFGVLTQDYDDTAALVASLDRVVCMQTAVAHLGGALGVLTDVFVPSISQWRYGQDHMPWYRSLTVRRQASTDWKPEIASLAETLSAYFRTIPGSAKNAA